MQHVPYICTCGVTTCIVHIPVHTCTCTYVCSSIICKCHQLTVSISLYTFYLLRYIMWIYKYTCTCRLHHDVQVSSRFSCTYRGLQARGCVNCKETKLSDVTDLYYGTNQICAALDTLSNQHYSPLQIKASIATCSSN